MKMRINPTVPRILNTSTGLIPGIAVKKITEASY